MTKIKTLKNNETGEKYAPRTHVKAVYDDNGNTLDSLLEVQDEKLSELGSELQTEVERATNAELELRKSLNTEVLRAKEAEEELENSINANRYGYNVTVNGLKGGIHTIETAIKDVPYKFRMLGQKIMFRTENGDWATYHNESLSLDNYENVNDWVQEVGISSVTGDINISNNPDYEDLTEADDGTIKFADKEYSAESFSGLGRVYLRKNIVDGVNVLTQDMISKPNTIYIIQYDYDLQGAEITVPEGCVLDFQGGSLSNGSVKGGVNLIGDYLRHINIEIKGDNITENFGITNYDDNTIVNSHIGSALNGIVIYEDVNVGEECALKTSIKSPCKSKVYFNEYTRGFLLVGVNGVEINNINIVKSIPVTDNGIIRYRQNIYIENCSDINIENCILNGSIDIVSETEEQNNIIIDKNYFDCDFTNINDPGDNSVQKDVIQISGTSDVRITNNYIKSKNVNRVFKTSSRTKNYVDIDLLCKNIYIENNTIISESELGKQMYDMFCGVTNVFFRYNNVKIKGFTRVIENKSIDANVKSVIHIVGNHIEHDSPRGNNFYFSFKADQHSFLNISNNTIITTNQGGQHYINFRGVNLQFNNNIYNGDDISTFYIEDKANQDIYVENNTFSQSRFFVSNTIEAESVNFISNKTSIIVEAFIYIYREAVVNKINLINNTYASTFLLSVISSGEFNSNVRIVSPIYNSSAILQGDIDGDLLDKISCEGGLLYREGKGYKASDHSVSSLDALRALYKAKEGTIAKQGTNGDLCIKSSHGWISFAKAVETKTKGTEEEKPSLQYYEDGYTYWNTTTKTLNIWDGFRWVGVDGYNPEHYKSNEFPSYSIPNGFTCFRIDLNALCIFLGDGWYKIPVSCKYDKNTSGTWADKPGRYDIVDIGFAYFCTDKQTAEGATNGIMIYYKGDGVWVDALGRVVK